MKSSSKKANLIWLLLLWGFLLVWFINLTNGDSTNILPQPSESGHVVRLHSLFLWNSVSDTGSAYMKINTGENFLEMQGWVAVWSGNSVNNSDSATIWWWLRNVIDAENLWILWWMQNESKWINSLIGGWIGNKINAGNAVVWWWSGNRVNGMNGVVVWWNANTVDGENAVVLWGWSNSAKWKNSLVMWHGAEWYTWSFAWSATGKADSARIDVDRWMLVWTNTPISGVRLVVAWPVSLANFTSNNLWTTWEIKVVNGCIYANDGRNWQVMGKSSRVPCGGAVNTCRFWEAILYEWDQADAYRNFYSENCSGSSTMVKVTCSGWNLVDDSNHVWTYYPYCYHVWS